MAYPAIPQIDRNLVQVDWRDTTTGRDTYAYTTSGLSRRPAEHRAVKATC